MGSINHSSQDAAVLVFGSQLESLNTQSLDEIRNTLVDKPSRQWVFETVSGLASVWNALASAEPEITNTIGQFRGQQLLEDLSSWLRLGPVDGQQNALLRDFETLPSMILSPLVILTHIAQYRRYLSELGKQAGKDESSTDMHAEFVNNKKTATLGFCMGSVSAFAVASAGNQDELDNYGSVAVRLAVVGGALIDAQDAWNTDLGLGPSKSYASAWRNETQREDMYRIVDGLFPEAYISVLYDEARATVTTSQRAASRLLRNLRKVGITTAEVGFHGDIHSPKPETKTQMDRIVAFCNKTPGLQLPDSADLAMPTFTNAGDGEPIGPGNGAMHEITMRAVFVQQCDWYGTFLAVEAARLDGAHDTKVAVAFGPDKCSPPTLMRQLGSRLVHFADLPLKKELPPAEPVANRETSEHVRESQPGVEHSQQQPQPQPQPQQYTASHGKADKNAIAVVGMSIKVAGADDLDEFSQMLRTGKSQHELITSDKMAFNDSLFRDKDERQWYANFMRDRDAFDHKFFKRSPRESASMDPQQRLLLQSAYQAVEQAGYFTEAARSSRNNDSDWRDNQQQHVGVYIGTPAVDYEHNVAGHAPNAFTATGNLQSFLAGRVAHWFGWTGPALTLDTACSSSAVAIHSACRDLLSGECNAALAGGVALCTNPTWFQNLAAASFLSPTGQCKPFDHKADGFCRAEGSVVVFLKRMADAVADGNPILGTIASSAVYQNQNSTPMFVPNSPSLSQLFRDVLKRADVPPGDISLVEAHGTGTPVGDPAEYASIRDVMGGRELRSKPLPIGSVKGHVGHAEGASGVVSLIKVLMMMRENFIPPQASFSKMNPAIKASPSDMVEVVTSLRPWSDNRYDDKKALINNYGACGSNAAMVVTHTGYQSSTRFPEESQNQRLPFRITGLDARSIRAYAAKLASFVKYQVQSKQKVTLADLSFNINRYCNPALSQSLVFSSSSLAELQDTISHIAAADAAAPAIEPSKPERPVILCFGGQVSTFVGLDRNLYESVALLRKHLDDVDATMQALPFGLGSIYPEIFSRSPCEDPVRLQTMLFAMQYACAMTWLDCGLSGNVAAVVGHSFGELTTLCVSGALSLQDASRMIARRAQLIRDRWGSDPGAMMAVEADQSLVRELVAEASRSGAPVDIACYNGPRSFTLSGSTQAINVVGDTIARGGKFSGIKSKKLNVTNASHSSLVDPLLDGLAEIGKDLMFKRPSIPLERATETRLADGGLTPSFMSDHMRNTVFFSQAINRLAEKYPSAVFLEAGSSSTITVMASRALAASGGSSSYFQAINITNDKGLHNMTDATASLWKQGVRVSFWAHNARQTDEYETLLLPPYQFEKSRHWMEMKSPADALNKALKSITQSNAQQRGNESHEVSAKDLGLWSFIGYQDEDGKDRNKGKKDGGKDKPRRPRFRINTDSDKYNKFFSGHVIAQTAPICPGTLQVDMAIEALFSIHPEWKKDGLQPIVQDMVNHNPLCADPSRVVWLDYKSLNPEQTQWEWNISSTSRDSDNRSNDQQMYVAGRLRVQSPKDPAYVAEFSRFERLVSHSMCTTLLSAPGRHDGSESDLEILQGRNVYRTFSEVVDYADMYRGVQTVVGRNSTNECAGRVTGRHAGETWVDVLLDDSFSQVGGFYVNCMTDTDSDDMFIANGIELCMRSPRGIINDTGNTQNTWHVYGRNTPQSTTGYLSDVFVFDSATGDLAEVFLGIQYSRMPKTVMGRLLTMLTKDKSVLKGGANLQAVAPVQKTTTSSGPGPTESSPRNANVSEQGQKPAKRKTKQKAQKKPSSSPRRADLTTEVMKLVALVAGMEASELTVDTEVADVGIDSLMGMELAREVESEFKCSVDQATLLEATNVRQLVGYISTILPGSYEGDASATSSASDESSGQDDETSCDEDTLSKSDFQPDSGIATPDSTEQSAGLFQDLKLSSTDILDAFGEVKLSSDKRLRDAKTDNFDRVVFPATSRLCVTLIVEAFEKLGCPLGSAAAGEVLSRVPYLPEYERLVAWLYRFLEQDARLIKVDPSSGQIIRTAVAVSDKSSDADLAEFSEAHPDWAVTARLIHHAGKPLASILSGETDGIRILFGSAEGRELMAAHYRKNPHAAMLGEQMRDTLGLLANKIRGEEAGTLKILEMGAGTGGTTHILVPYLASLGIAVEYTFTDLSSSMVAQARRTLGKEYPFMRFAVHDIEKEPAEELHGQHIIIASNAIHATHNLSASVTNVRQALRPDGFLMMLEQTEDIPLSNLIFGLFEGWWLFDDGRTHAVVQTPDWERTLHQAGYGHVDWTDGHLPENSLQRIIIALASGPPLERLPIPESRPEGPQQSKRDLATREAEAERYVTRYTADWAVPSLAVSKSGKKAEIDKHDCVVLVTGTTGSLGSHLAASLAEHPDVATVVCVNRRSSAASVETRQDDAFSRRGISLSPEARSKLRVLETDTSRPQLGLPEAEYDWLVQHGTHIIHNAWPMSGTRALPGFEPQFQAMRNLLGLARDMALSVGDGGRRVGFQLVTSIGVVGHAGQGYVSEQRVTISAVLPTGYCEGKWICERMLDETLHKHPALFRPMVVRPGQIAGSTTSGFWNPVEHFAFLVKSAQSVGSFPALAGVQQWVPVDKAAAIMAELLHVGNEANAPSASPVYHIDNPVGQTWYDTVNVLARALGIPPQGVVPFRTWLRRVSHSPLREAENPVGAQPMLFDFLDRNFERMSCGGLILDTTQTQLHSKTMAALGPVSAKVVEKYVESWKQIGFLSP
ncbi:Conidial yellow pigment biosynthesis polyketide synthase [Diaporthe amygdali]|uniref:Conidial yellow pigment biosynthesis polyketide synthase n=1 Tax=Phomopsis amygdali TaxID=1214568 RepID=UPI0022FF022B|nr:Conidial yellow pigment biosynthesis polyketide synthase [Diaporthe amygdali]KAJ0115250.1 Conidial yellow pigment biosynthesis polyketide synthase [Diaporthe amygdali]